MTDLKIRKLPFRFDDPVPFQWNPANPEFGLVANAIGILVVAFEDVIVSVVRQVLPRIEDPEVVAEATAFLRQEALHSRAHQAHLAALVRRYPGLQETIDGARASYQRLLEENSLEFLVAYTASLEATFPPLFKMILDHREDLLAPGDARVASLFAWHFVEEIEHRSSALILYDAIVRDPNYRLRVVGPAFAHAAGVYSEILASFDRHVPFEDRLVDSRRVVPHRAWMYEIGVRIPGLARLARGAFPAAFEAVPSKVLGRTFARLMLSQLPNHRPANEPIPEFADQWFQAYERGDDMTRFGVSTPAGR